MPGHRGSELNVRLATEVHTCSWASLSRLAIFPKIRGRTWAKERHPRSIIPNAACGGRCSREFACFRFLPRVADS
jgi:hypothetical protein